MLAVLPAHRRAASAVCRFPPGCGRPRTRNADAGKPPRPLPLSGLPNPSARAATTTAAPPPRRAVPAATTSGTVGTDRDAGNGREALTAVTVRRASAVRRYPPGCGRGVAIRVPVAEPPALVLEGEAEVGASKPPAELCIEAKAKACGREAVLSEYAIDDIDSRADGAMEEGGGGDTGAQEEGCGKPWVVTGHMAVPFLPWAQHGRRSQRLKA